MKALSLHHISNPSLIDQDSSPHSNDQLNNALTDETKTATYSFRHEFNKLRTAKSQGELYQPQFPLVLPPMSTAIIQEDNPNDYHTKSSCESPSSLTIGKSRNYTVTMPATATITNSTVEPSTTSSSQKLPIWKRLKKIITPSKRNKEQSQQQQRKQSSSKVSTQQLNGVSNETSKMNNNHNNNNSHRVLLLSRVVQLFDIAT